MEKYWDKAAECMSRDELSALQSQRLVKLVERIYENVPYYKAKMDAIGLLPGDIKSIEDLPKLPYTYKQDLRDTYPYGLFATSLDNVVRLHASSGTTGKQIVVGYTKDDLELWDNLVARCMTMAGLDNKSRIQISYGYGLFTGGLGANGGSQKIGAITVPASTGNTKRQINCIVDFGVTAICCTPSYALFIAETMEEMGIDTKTLPLSVGIFGAEPWTEAMRNEIQNRLNIKAHDIYGLSEIMGPGVAMDCHNQNGLHIWEDHFIPEIINPDTGENLPEKTTGELVFTTLTKQAFPLIRYRTRDISSLNYDKCECGRTCVRMAKPSGRSDDMLIIRGVNVFPSQIETVLLDMGETAPHYMIIVDRVNNRDTLEIQVEMSDKLISDEVKRVEDIKAKIARNVESILGISAKITLVEAKSIQRSEGKAKHVIDKRKL